MVRAQLSCSFAFALKKMCLSWIPSYIGDLLPATCYKVREHYIGTASALQTCGEVLILIFHEVD